ncbi:MAG: hypothetical protein WC356_04825 [Candidatus Micrarchaeia archaeon]|jgi:hypothetical protein
MICFYHRGDLDGHCSGAIVRHRYPECKMVGIDYEDEFPWADVSPGEDVIMCDFSLPMDQMERLRILCIQPQIFWVGGKPHHNFTWIDHHKTAIDKAREAGFVTPGLRVVGKAGCELTWEYLFPDEPMPCAVFLLGRYDVWDERNVLWTSDILPFQYGLRKELTDPANPDTAGTWEMILRAAEFEPIFEGLIGEGNAILTYQHQQDEKLMARHAFITTLDGIAALAVNNGPGGSMKFEPAPPGHHLFFISFARLPGKKWLVNLYTFRDDVDCGEIAKRHGGGGHRKAAGFICTQLPFEI